VPRELGDKRVLITFAMRDFGLPAKSVLPRLRAAFRDVEVVALPEAKHFFAEDAPEEVALAVSRRFR
jgi:haloalkane dehalogenase